MSFAANSHNFVSVPLGLLLCGISGAAAGCIAAITTNPMDVARTRLQVLDSSSRQNFVSVLRELLHREGWKALMRGMKPRVLV